MPDQPPVPRIGFNAALLSLSADYRSAGIHRYIVGLLSALAHTGDIAVTAFTAEPNAGSVVPPSIALWRAPRWTRRPLGRIVWEQTGLPFALRRVPADLYHGAAFSMPRLCPVPAVVTVHDLSFFRLPETFPPRQGAYLRAATRLSVNHSAAIVAVSDFTRRELIELLAADPGRVHTVPNGLDPACRPLHRHELEAYRSRTGLPSQYILTVGTLQPRKNLGTLLEAYAELRRRDPTAPDLVVAGAHGWGDDDLSHRAAELGITSHVRRTGFVPTADLPALYGAARVFALPSRYEGFGLPVIEAMACGVPTIVSAASSLPEVAGEAGITVEPEDVRGWAAALAAVLDNPQRSAHLVELGLARAARFSWARTAREMSVVYRTALHVARVPTGGGEVRHGPA